MDPHPVRVKLRPPADIFGMLLLIVMSFPIYWDRVRDGRHLARVDIINQFLPNYTYLGARLRSGDLPGWNPYSSSGMPFLGDALSGWGYLPAMMSFTLLPPFTATQANYFIHVWLGAIGAYMLSRIIGLGVWGALAAGLAYEYGALLSQLRSVNSEAQLTAWIPCAFVGVEIAIRAKTLRGRASGWGLGGLALSQMIVGWTGQGSAYALFIVSAYAGARMVCAAVSHWDDLLPILGRHLSDGLAIVVFGIGLSAAGLWIRLEVNRDSLIAGGDYSAAVGVSHRAHYFPRLELLNEIFIRSTHHYVGAATLSLAVLAFFVVQHARWRVWVNWLVFFFVVDLLVTHPIVRPILFREGPFERLHEHNVSKGFILLGIPVALLAGLTVDALARWIREWHVLAGLACVPILGIAAVSYWVRRQDPGVMQEPRTAAYAVGLIIGAYSLLLAVRSFLPKGAFPLLRGLALTGLFAVLVWDPFGDQFGNPLSSRVMTLPPSKTFETYLATSDPDGPGGFLQDRLAIEGPLRFFGYGPSVLISEGPRANTTYHGRFRDRLVVELLFGRAMRLGLPSVQGYNPLQNKRYTEFLVAVNGKTQNYHDANILRSGVDSPLLRLLHVRYIIVERDQTDQFQEIDRLERNYPVVYEDSVVKVLEVTDALPHAWIVHEARQASREQAISLIQSEDFNPASTAIVEGPLPELKTTKNPDLESVRISEYGADEIELSASLRTPGIVVISEIYARGWQAFVDGKPAAIYPTDYVLRGVAVPAGNHTIVLRYAPAAIPRGIGVTTLTILVLVALIVQPWRYAARVRQRLKVTNPTNRRSNTSTQEIAGAVAMEGRAEWDSDRRHST